MAKTKKRDRARIEAEAKRDRDRAERESKRMLAQEEGEQTLAAIMEEQASLRKQNKKRAKKVMAARATAVEAEESEEDDAAASDEEYDSDVEALRRIRAVQAVGEAGELDGGDAEENGEADGSEDEEAIEEDLDTLMLERLDDFQLKLPFSETMAVVADQPLELENAHDDLTREVEFYKQALNAVKAGRKMLDRAKILHYRPADYFAEMIKSDAHMARIKQNLLFEKKKMEAFEQRKKQQEYKKFAKKVQAEKIREKASHKAKAKDLALEFRSKNKEIMGEKGKPKPNPRRAAKNQKYGVGKSSASRRNTAESVGSMFKRDTPNKKARRGGRR